MPIYTERERASIEPMSEAGYELVVPLKFLSDGNPKFAQMCLEMLETVRKTNIIPSYATDSKMEGLRIVKVAAKR